ncbi:iron ABC transporter permease [Thalassotalea sp. LPB0316]|uniref:FecCD family ABC transporter permease n=1 Tax=Thalassotalea sp. LPB0316 TaxID=2769490 RepID=UPI0018680A55|nr:iron ABC transporter permease [Thalassotalea sp. LPB0316]QOL25937.1 iron ABC transporter permease [Thalassotalea sp. LPB0316]
MSISAKITVSGLVVCSLMSLLAGLSIGAIDIPLDEVLAILFADTSDNTQAGMYSQVIWQLRLPRTLMAFIAGAGLALSGMVLQTVTRNPLADPYLFGVSSGASFAVVLAMVIFDIDLYRQLATVELSVMSIAAFIGSLSVIAILVALTRYQANMHTLVLAGVALSFLFSALTSFLLYFSDPQAISAILFWTLGSFTRANLASVGLCFAVFLITVLIVLGYYRRLNSLILGDETAVTLGVNPSKIRSLMLALSALMTAVLVANCGGIGFVGLIIPHIVRRFLSQGASLHPIVVAMVGGIFMILVDTLSRVVIANQELPIGIITAAIGSIFFLLLLVRNNRHHSAFLK